MSTGKKLKRWCPLLACFCLLPMAHIARGASTFEVELAPWNAEISGYAYYTQVQVQNVSVNLRNDLGLSRNLNGMFRAVWNNGSRILPDWEFGYTHINSNGTTILQANITWGDYTFAANGQVKSQVLLKTGYALAFWRPIKTRLVDLKAGVEARWMNLNIPISGTAVQTVPVQQFIQAHTSGGNVAWVPMAYIGVTLHVIRRLDLAFGGAYVRYKDSYYYDSRAWVAYYFDSGVMLSTGWRRLRLNFDDTSFTINGNMQFEGLYFAVGYRF